jgi:tRNA(fMet)-specific endonuclease VapC
MDITELCLDTSILINFLKGREPSASALVHAVTNFSCTITSVTVYELLYGMARSKKQIGENALLGVMRVLAFDDAAARRAAKLHDDLIRNNQEIGIKDILIAAICLEHTLPLVTTNIAHFVRVPNLQIISPEELLVQTR